MSLLAIVRHGQSQWNLENKFTGEMDVDLTPLGRMEAHVAGQKLKPYVFDQGFTSALRRAQETLAIILEESDNPLMPVTRSKSLNERNYGALQGLDKTATALQYGSAQVDIWRRSFAVAPPDGESLQDTAARVIGYYNLAIDPLLKKGENILIVAHGNSLRSLMMYLEHLSPQAIEQVDIPTGRPRLYHFNTAGQATQPAYL